MSDSEPEVAPVKKEKRKINEKQMANLRKGMEMMKAKRAEREQFEEKKAKGEIPADAPRPVAAPKPPKVVKVSAPPPEPAVIQVERKKRAEKVKIAVDDVKSELAALRSELSAMKKPAEVKEVVKEVAVDRVVEKTKLLSGSEMLNAIFFK